MSSSSFSKKVSNIFRDKSNLLIACVFIELILGAIAVSVIVSGYTAYQQAQAQTEITNIIKSQLQLEQSNSERRAEALVNPDSTILPNSFNVIFKNNTVDRTELANRVNEIVSDSPYDTKIPNLYGAGSNKGFNIITTNATVIEELKKDPDVQMLVNDRVSFLHIHTETGRLQYPDSQDPDHRFNRIDEDQSPTANVNNRENDKTGKLPDVDVMVIDSGVQADHPDLNVVFQAVSSPPECAQLKTCATGDIFDDRYDNHGTSVAGIIGARDNLIGTVGVMPGVRIWSFKICHALLSGKDFGCPNSSNLTALNFALQHSNEIDEVHESIGGLGYGGQTCVQQSLVTDLKNAGVPVTISAGNDHHPINQVCPGKIPAAITVTAINDGDGKCGGVGPAIPGVFIPGPQGQGGPGGRSAPNPDDRFTTYSNFGPEADMAAPSEGGGLAPVYGDAYAPFGGTSMAGPVVAGAAALYINKIMEATGSRPTAAATESALKSNGVHFGDTCDGRGHGYFTNDADSIHEPLVNVKGF